MLEYYISILKNYFNKNFFTDNGSKATIDKIQHKIEEFDLRHPSLVSDLLFNLKTNFPTAEIENHTQFFNNDRCFRFLVKISEEDRYVLQIGIFEIFSVYQRSFKMIGDRYQYGNIKFIDRAESSIADKIYNCLPDGCKDFVWLNKNILNETIPFLSIVEKNSQLSNIVKVADALFTTHYI